MEAGTFPKLETKNRYTVAYSVGVCHKLEVFIESYEFNTIKTFRGSIMVKKIARAFFSIIKHLIFKTCLHNFTEITLRHMGVLP